MEIQEQIYESYLMHHGIKGQKWGIRRFEKKGGGLTSAGKSRYGEAYEKSLKSGKSNLAKSGGKKSSGKAVSKTGKKQRTQEEQAKHDARVKKAKTALKVGAGLAAAGLAAYGAKKGIHKLNESVQTKRGKEAANLHLKMFYDKPGNSNANVIASAKRRSQRIKDEAKNMNTVNAAKNVAGYYKDAAPKAAKNVASKAKQTIKNAPGKVKEVAADAKFNAYVNANRVKGTAGYLKDRVANPYKFEKDKWGNTVYRKYYR